MRPLNKDELAIITIKEKRTGEIYTPVGIEYRKLFPRTTLCILNTGFTTDVKPLVFGIAMRAKGEDDIPANGEVIAFTRALNAYYEEPCYYSQ